jgi:hypothetical protein
VVNYRHFVLAGTLVVAVAVMGCKNRDAELVGKWKIGDLGIPKSASDSFMGSLGTAMASSMKDTMPLEFKPDKSFTWTMFVFPVEGTWALNGDTVNMRVTKVMGQDLKQVAQEKAKTDPKLAMQLKDNPNALDEPMTATLSADGKTLMFKGSKGKPATLNFVRDTPAASPGT